MSTQSNQTKVSKPSIYYDASVASSYDADRASEYHWNAENHFVENLFSHRRFTKILDLPVGTGRFLRYYPTTTNVIGVDLSEEMLAIASKNLNLNQSLALGDVEALSYPDGYFDCVICFRLFHLLDKEQRLKAVCELTRVSSDCCYISFYMDSLGHPPESNAVKPSFLDQRVSSSLRRAISKIKDILKAKNCISPASTSPWHHIPSYSITADDIVDLANVAGCKLIALSYLCDYLSYRVVVAELKVNAF